MQRPLATVVLGAAVACTADSVTHPSSIADVVAPVTIIGAGDVHARCDDSHPSNASAAMVAKHPGALVFVTGDNAGARGTHAEYTCYDGSWGRFKSRTIPVIGNHERNTDTLARGYYDYFNGTGVDSGRAGHRARGYYTVRHGAWRIYVVNSQQHWSDQSRWIARDLAANPTLCTMAIWHRPLFTSSSRVRPLRKVEPIWRALYDGGADVVLTAHSHQYERFARMKSDGARDPAQGIRHLVAGTGGGIRMAFMSPPHPASQVRIDSHGVLKLTLWPDRYAWEFVSLTGQILDSGQEACHS
jgi:acid phosphatase type 7